MSKTTKLEDNAGGGLIRQYTPPARNICSKREGGAGGVILAEEAIMVFDWLGKAIDLYRDLSPGWETKWVEGRGLTANQAARAEGWSWVAGDVDYESGMVQVHRKKRKK